VGSSLCQNISFSAVGWPVTFVPGEKRQEEEERESEGVPAAAP
jgi:hypothetical protein